MSAVHPLRRAVSTGVVVVLITGCYSFQAIPPRQLTLHSTHEHVRVVEHNGVTLTLDDARISGDTLYGTPTGAGAREVAIPFTSIYTVAAREKDEQKTTALAAGIALAVGAVVVFGIASQ
jgi:hypothetical protein